jgi:hypothetical protein
MSHIRETDDSFSALPPEGEREIVYRFPYSRTAIELVPDIGGSYRLRLHWHRGKTVIAPFETTALRPIAEVQLRGQRYPIFFTQHARRRREKVVLAGRRKTARSPRCTLRFLAFVEGREDRLTWTWRIGATAAALETAAAAAGDTKVSPDSVTLHLPFTPGRNRVISLADAPALAVWTGEIAVTIVARSPDLCLRAGERGIELSVPDASLGAGGVTLVWETRLLAARSEAETLDALVAHVADVADTDQIPPDTAAPFLTPLAQGALAALMADNRVEKRGVERLVYRARPGDGKRLVGGAGADSAQAACALLLHHYLCGDDALRRRARLLAHGLTDFQVSEVESPHWGALWDVLLQKSIYAAADGGRTLSLATAARTARGLHALHAHFGTDLMSRTALGAAQWLLLRMDRYGMPIAERFQEDGPPVEGGSPWVVGEILIPLVETFRSAGNETYLKAALRSIATIQERVAERLLRPEEASTDQLAATIEGVLLASREYENERLIALASRLGTALRSRRRPNGAFDAPESGELSATLAAVRASLALTRVDADPIWPSVAVRGLRHAHTLVGSDLSARSIADLGALGALPLQLLLTIATRAGNAVADPLRLTITRGWQTFGPDPATRNYVRVTLDDETPVDYLALVCPISLQVLISVVAPPGTQNVQVTKNGRKPYLKHLLTGGFDQAAPLVPLGDGQEAMIGVFLADT